MVLHMAARSTDDLTKWEHPKKSGIWIREFIYQQTYKGEKRAYSGYQVLVPGKVMGAPYSRKRRQFRTKVKAQAWASKIARGLTLQGKEFFKATDAERREFATIMPRLRKKGISLSEAAEFALARMQPSSGERLLSAVVKELQDSKQMRHENGDLAASSLKDFIDRSRRIATEMGNQLIHEIDSSQIKKWASDIEGSNRTRMNYLRIASEIFRYAKQKHYLRENPMEDLSDNDRKEIHGRLIHGGDISVLSIGQADSFINFTASEFPEFLGAITLGLFCGIRTEELKQLTWDNVSIEEGYVTIDPSIAKKRRMRHVTIPNNAREWLTLCSERKGTISPYSGKIFEHQFRRLRLNAGFKDKAGKSTWPANGMRHSYGTYHYALHADSNLTSRELGHKAGDDVLFNHYRALAKQSDGLKYFAIKPDSANSKIVEFTA